MNVKNTASTGQVRPRVLLCRGPSSLSQRSASPIQRLRATGQLCLTRVSHARHLRLVRIAASSSVAVHPSPDTFSDGNGPGKPTSALASLANSMTTLFPIWVLGAAIWAVVQPAAFTWFRSDYITTALAVTMLGMGLTLTFDDFKRVLTTPGRIFAGFALQYTIMPAMAFAVSRLAGLPLEYTIGLCLVGSCPGGTASNVVTYLAKADVTLSVMMTTASTLGAVVATPLLTKLLLGTLVPVNAMALLISTVQVVLLPVVAGAALNQAFPAAVAVLSPLCALSAVLLIALICGSVVAHSAGAVAQAGPQLLGAIFALHAGGFLFGYAFSRLFGMPERAARTNSIEVGMQNSALGALLASLHFPAHPLAAVPCAISACMHSVMGSLLAAWWRGRTVGDEAATAEEAQRAKQAAEVAALQPRGKGEEAAPPVGQVVAAEQLLGGALAAAVTPDAPASSHSVAAAGAAAAPGASAKPVAALKRTPPSIPNFEGEVAAEQLLGGALAAAIVPEGSGVVSGQGAYRAGDRGGVSGVAVASEEDMVSAEELLGGALAVAITPVGDA